MSIAVLGRAIFIIFIIFIADVVVVAIAIAVSGIIDATMITRRQMSVIIFAFATSLTVVVYKWPITVLKVVMAVDLAI